MGIAWAMLITFPPEGFANQTALSRGLGCCTAVLTGCSILSDQWGLSPLLPMETEGDAYISQLKIQLSPP